MVSGRRERLCEGPSQRGRPCGVLASLDSNGGEGEKREGQVWGQRCLLEQTPSGGAVQAGDNMVPVPRGRDPRGPDPPQVSPAHRRCGLQKLAWPQEVPTGGKTRRMSCVVQTTRPGASAPRANSVRAVSRGGGLPILKCH